MRIEHAPLVSTQCSKLEGDMFHSVFLWVAYTIIPADIDNKAITLDWMNTSRVTTSHIKRVDSGLHVVRHMHTTEFEVDYGMMRSEKFFVTVEDSTLLVHIDMLI